LALVLSGVATLSTGHFGSVAGASTLDKSATNNNSSSIQVESRAVAPVNRSVPVHLSIPAIGVSTGIQQLGLLANGSPQVPSGWNIAGWYKLGPSPGQVGSAVILGHVDSVGGPAVFYRLNKLKVGNQVMVKLASGQTVTFKVIALRQYLKAKFPLQTVYGPRSYPSLQLVTCGGSFDSKTGHYLSSIVAFTKLVKT
jgi:sortase (surface protein transpeptidase)